MDPKRKEEMKKKKKRGGLQSNVQNEIIVDCANCYQISIYNIYIYIYMKKLCVQLTNLSYYPSVLYPEFIFFLNMYLN